MFPTCSVAIYGQGHLPDKQPVLPPVRLVVDHFPRLYHPREVVDLKGDVVGVNVGDAVANTRVVPGVAIPRIHPGGEGDKPIKHTG